MPLYPFPAHPEQDFFFKLIFNLKGNKEFSQ